MTRAQDLCNTLYITLTDKSRQPWNNGDKAALAAGLEVVAYGLDSLDRIAHALERLAQTHAPRASQEPTLGA